MQCTICFIIQVLLYKVKMWMIGHGKYKTCFGRNPALQLQNKQMCMAGFDKYNSAKPGNPDIGSDKFDPK